MNRLNRFACGLAATVVTVLPSRLLAQGEDLSEVGSDVPDDFRGKITLAYGLVFALVVVFIVLSHRRNAGLAEEVEFLEKRLNEIES